MPRSQFSGWNGIWMEHEITAVYLELLSTVSFSWTHIFTGSNTSNLWSFARSTRDCFDVLRLVCFYWERPDIERERLTPRSESAQIKESVPTQSSYAVFTSGKLLVCCENEWHGLNKSHIGIKRESMFRQEVKKRHVFSGENDVVSQRCPSIFSILYLTILLGWRRCKATNQIHTLTNSS